MTVISYKKLKKAIQLFYQPDFWKHCPAPKRDAFVLQIFVKSVQNINNINNLYNLLNKIQVFKPFLADIKLIRNILHCQQKIIQLLLLFYPSNIQADIEIKGTTDVVLYKMSKRDQYIVIIGESHDYEGNSNDFLKQLSSQYNCPIHVLVEKSFDEYWKYSVHQAYNSNSTVFYFPPLSYCTRKGKIPKNAEVMKQREHKDYFDHCIAPYRGRVKIWAVDIRSTSIFHLVCYPQITIWYELGQKQMLDNVKNKKEWKEWLEASRKVQLNLLDMDLARKDLDAYDKKIKDGIIQAYKKIPEGAPFLKMSMERLTHTMKEVLDTRDKSHLHFMISLMYLPIEMTRVWITLIKEKLMKDAFYVLFMIGVHDLYMMVRLYRILTTQKEGWVVFFGGYVHSGYINKLISLTKDELKVERIAKTIGTGKDHSVKISLPKIRCGEKLQGMKLF